MQIRSSIDPIYCIFYFPFRTTSCPQLSRF